MLTLEYNRLINFVVENDVSGTEYREYSPNVLKINQNTELKKHFHPFSTKNADLKNNFTSLMFEDFQITPYIRMLSSDWLMKGVFFFTNS
jgi:hypothetical protein